MLCTVSSIAEVCLRSTFSLRDMISFFLSCVMHAPFWAIWCIKGNIKRKCGTLLKVLHLN